MAVEFEGDLGELLEELRTLRQRVKAADRLREAVRDIEMSHDKQCFMMRYGHYCDCGLPELKEAIEAYDKGVKDE